ncbi:alpha/beta hydrolase [Thermomonospora umbrina]|nr:alpha/beta hydrolase-fold protein [Thermomonospora umbrina]
MKTLTRVRRGRLLGGAVATLCAMALAVAVPSPASAAPPVPTPAQLPALNSHGITATWNDNTGTAGVGTAEMHTSEVYVGGSQVTLRVNIWFPPNYSPSGAAVPVAYVLHGGNGKYSDILASNYGDLLSYIGNTNFNGIIVMPEGGRSGWYQNWAANTRGGFRPQWENFHIGQLVPWVDANFNTLKDRTKRYVAGISMGGYGALKYATRHNHIFGSVASISGGGTIYGEEAMNTIDHALVTFGSAVELEGYPWTPNWNNHQLPATFKEERLPLVFGPMSGWDEYSPIKKLDKFPAYDNRIWLYSGTAETNNNNWTVALHNALYKPDTRHQFCQGGGGHDWPEFKKALEHFLNSANRTSFIGCPGGWNWIDPQ